MGHAPERGPREPSGRSQEAAGDSGSQMNDRRGARATTEPGLQADSRFFFIRPFSLRPFSPACLAQVSLLHVCIFWACFSESFFWAVLSAARHRCRPRSNLKCYVRYLSHLAVYNVKHVFCIPAECVALHQKSHFLLARQILSHPKARTKYLDFGLPCSVSFGLGGEKWGNVGN